jgi:hypothetical protein
VNKASEISTYDRTVFKLLKIAESLIERRRKEGAESLNIPRMNVSAQHGGISIFFLRFWKNLGFFEIYIDFFLRF